MKKLSEDVDIFKNFEISDPKSQNAENLKNHVFDVFRWIWQVFLSFFSLSIFFRFFFQMFFFIDTTLSPQPCLRRPSSIELSLVSLIGHPLSRWSLSEIIVLHFLKFKIN